MSDNEEGRFEVLLEEVRHHLSIVAEGHGALVDRIDGVEERLNVKIELLNVKVDTGHRVLVDRIDDLDAKIDGVEERLDAKIDGVEERLDAKIDGVEDRLTSEIRKVQGAVGDHEQRIVALEREAS